MQTVFAVYVTYHPNQEYLNRSISALLPQVTGIIIADNSEPPTENALAVETKRLEYLGMGKNVGIAAALNTAFNRCRELGADWVLTMDQDSCPPENLVEVLMQFADSETGQIGPLYSGCKSFTGTKDVSHVICSGALNNVDAFTSVGGFRDDLFIDMVDIDYSLRLKQAGYKVVQTGNITLEHHLGEGLGGLYIAGKYRLAYVKHKPFRWYYITRNTLEICKKYKLSFPDFCRKTSARLVKSIVRMTLFGPQRAENLQKIFAGIKDYRNRKFGEISSQTYI